MMQKRRLLSLTTLALVSLTLLHCSSVSSLFVSDADEERLGAQFDAQLRADPKKYPLYNTSTANGAAVRAYVQAVFDKVASQVPADEKPAYSFKSVQIIADPATVNAFAVPGGYVYVYTGILLNVQNESELAAVLGHELTHVVHHHYRTQLAEQYGMQVLADMLGGDSSQVSQIAQSLLSLKFSRDDESDADQNGTVLVGRAGYNPMGIATFFQRMPSVGIDVLSDHPDSPTRVAAVTSQVNSTAWLKDLVTNGKTEQVDPGLAAIQARLR